MWSAGNTTRTRTELFLLEKASTLAPWDIDHFRATGPESTVYDLINIRMNSFQIPAYYIDVVDLPYSPAPQSIPDGSYAFEIKDDLNRTDSATFNYAFDPVPAFSGGSSAPADNAYIGTNLPMFAWPRVVGDAGDGKYRYFIRISGYTASNTTGIIWYQSESSTNVSCTVPANLNLPRGSSYEWQWIAMGPGGDYENNWRFSDFQTFTINALSTTLAPVSSLLLFN